MSRKPDRSKIAIGYLTYTQIWALSRDPSFRNVAEAFGFKEEDIDVMEQIIKRREFSLDEPIGDNEEGLSIGETIAGDQDTQGFAERNILSEYVEEILSPLPQRYRDVLILRFGLNDEVPRTLEEVGKIFNVTRERIRQIENAGLRQLRQSGSRDKV